MKFLPGSSYGPRHAQSHASVMRAIKKMTPGEFVASLEAAKLGPVLDIGGRRASATKKRHASHNAKRGAKKTPAPKRAKRA